MLLAIRRALPGITSPAAAAALGVSLRRTWSDAKIRGLVHDIGARAEGDASRPWHPFDRRDRKRIRDGARMDAKTYDGKKLLDAWTKTATSKITSVRDEVAKRMRMDIIKALEKGTKPADLTRKWLREGIPVTWGTAEGRLKVIAQDQLSTLHAQVQSERARAVGVREFIWRTQGDSRVRAAHVALDGTKHRYDRPPSEGLPGQPINCRCWAESVIPDELAISVGFAIG
jgi:SPP1 gp7 family putative phage head morphogenesis protein